MHPKVVVRACNKNFAQHLLSYPPATNGDKRNLGRLRYSCQRAPEQSINTSWIHRILKLKSIPFGVPSYHHWDRRFRTIIGAYNSLIGSGTPTISRKLIYFGVYHLCYNLLFLMLVTLGPSDKH